MLGTVARCGPGHPPTLVRAVAAWLVGCPPLHQPLGTRPTLRGSRERGMRADLVAFLGNVRANGHDLVVEDVVLFYLAVDQRQIGPKALAV